MAKGEASKMAENENINQKAPIVGRTFWDIAIASSYIMGGAIFIISLGVILYFTLDGLPTWFFISVAGSLAFIPFLIDRAKEDSKLFVITKGALNMTEYRIGKKYGLKIDGNGVLFSSDSGTNRTILTDFDEQTRTAKGSTFGSYTQIDQVRDMTTLEQLSQLLEDTLRETRVSKQTVGIEVEKQSKVIVDWALKTIYGSIIPTEISEIFGVSDEHQAEFEHKKIDDLVGEIDDD